MGIKIIKDPIKNFIYALDFPFNWNVIKFCQKTKDKAGLSALYFKYKKWRFSELAIVDLIRSAFPDVVLEPAVEVDLVSHNLWKANEVRRMSKALELKNVLETDFVVNNLILDLYPYQRVGVEFLENNNGRCVIADEMGVGKTCQALGYLAHECFKKTVVVCPATAKGVWKKETKKFTRLKPFVMTTAPLTEEIWSNHDIFIINYDSISKHSDFLMAKAAAGLIDCLIVDESHRIKNPKTIRTRVVGLLSRNIPHFIALSGSPLLNRPIELFTLLHIINFEEWPDFDAYRNRYCWSKEKLNYDGASNLDELRGKIASYFLRRTKDQVLPYLPKRIYSEIPIELDSENAADYADAEAGLVKDILSGEKIDAINALQVLNELRKIASLGKIDQGIDLIQDLIENDKVIIFSSFNEPLRQLKEYFGSQAVEITYKITKDEDRDLAVSEFQNNPNVKIFLGGMRAAGEAISLTAGKTTVFWDLDWVPATMDQCASRNHRPGVIHESLNVIQLITPGSIDERMKLVIEKKRKTFDELFAKDPKKAHNYMVESLLSDYKKENAEGDFIKEVKSI